MSLYRGTIAFDAAREKRSDAGTGRGRDKNHYREYRRLWRVKNREHIRAYDREYRRRKMDGL